MQHCPAVTLLTPAHHPQPSARAPLLLGTNQGKPLSQPIAVLLCAAWEHNVAVIPSCFERESPLASSSVQILSKQQLSQYYSILDRMIHESNKALASR